MFASWIMYDKVICCVLHLVSGRILHGGSAGPFVGVGLFANAQLENIIMALSSIGQCYGGRAGLGGWLLKVEIRPVTGRCKYEDDGPDSPFAEDLF